MFLTSTRLALIACRYLTEAYYDTRKLPAPDIATEYSMNTRSLMPALRRLTQVGILRSQTGGSEPGFIFARDPKLISMYEVIVALEGVTKMACCRDVVQGITCDIENYSNCGVYNVVNDGLALLRDKFKDVTVYDHYASVAQTAHNKEENEGKEIEEENKSI